MVEDKASSEKAEKLKKVKCSKVKSNKNIKSTNENGKKKVNKPKKEPVNDHQLNSDENSLKPEVNNDRLEIKPKTEVKDETKPKTEMKSETKHETKVINEEHELVDNEKTFHEVNKWMDPSYEDLPDHLTDHKNPVD